MAKDTKERILAAALDMFSQNGYAGTNIRELTASLGLVKSSMYKHFESKEEIWKWMPVLALASFAAAVFMIADGYYWPGVAFIGAGTSLYSATASCKKKNEASEENQDTKKG